MSGQGSFGAFRTHGLGADGWTPLGCGRRKIEAEDIAFALASRSRMGWQTIARIRGVNEADLRKACERAGAIPPPPAPAELAPRKPFLSAREVQVLQALAAGDRSPDEIARRLDVEAVNVRGLVCRLRAKGLAGTPRSPERGYRLTAAGRAALEAHGHG